VDDASARVDVSRDYCCTLDSREAPVSERKLHTHTHTDGHIRHIHRTVVRRQSANGNYTRTLMQTTQRIFNFTNIQVLYISVDKIRKLSTYHTTPSSLTTHFFKARLTAIGLQRVQIWYELSVQAVAEKTDCMARGAPRPACSE